MIGRTSLLVFVLSLSSGCLLIDGLTGDGEIRDAGPTPDVLVSIDLDDAATTDGPAGQADAGPGSVADASFGMPDAAPPEVICALDQGCSNPTPMTNTICGQLFDAETNQPLWGAVPVLAGCGSGGTDGPCGVMIRVFDALQYAANPTGTTPLAPTYISINDCGQFEVRDVATPALGFLAIETQDAAGNGQDDYAPAGQLFAVAGGQKIENLRVFVLRHTTDAAWTANAGSPFGAGVTFSEHGAFMPVFMGPDGAGGKRPYADVNLSASAGGSRSFHFADMTADSRISMVNAMSRTGPNGTGVITDTDLVNHIASGGEPANCAWPDRLADSIPGVVLIGDWEAESNGGGPCL